MFCTKQKYREVTFFVDVEDKNRIKYIQEEIICYEESNVLLITLLTLGLTLLLGLLVIIIMKLIVRWLDIRDHNALTEDELATQGKTTTHIDRSTLNKKEYKSVKGMEQ